MKTFMAASNGLLPLTIFWALTGFRHPDLAIALGLAFAAVTFGWRIWVGTVKSLEAVVLAFLVVLAVARLANVGWLTDHAVAASFAVLGLFSLGGAGLRRPWTAEYARGAYAGVVETPEFLIINRMITAIWGVIFLFYALAQALALGPWPMLAGGILGALGSVFGPKRLMHAVLHRKLGRQEAYDWPVPSMPGARGNGGYDVIIIGAGNGGLTAAALLADAGASVLVAEQHDQVGGFASNWRREIEHNGARRMFRFDAGVHDISGAWPGGPIASILDRVGAGHEIEWLPLDHTYRVGPLKLDVPREWRAHAKQVAALFPASAAGIEAFFRDAHAIFEGMYSTAASNGGIPGPIHDLDELIAFPGKYPLATRWMTRPFSEFLDSHVTDPAAQKVVRSLTGYITDRPETLTVADMIPIYGYYFRGGVYPKGGSSRLAEAFAGAVRANGGEIRLKSAVKRIVVENGKAAGIEFATGERLRAAAVISNADYRRTFLELIDPANLPADFRAKVARSEPACSAFRVHLALDFVPDLRPAQNIVSADGLGMEIVLPSLIDPSAAPSGYCTLEMTTLLSHAEAREWFPTEAGADLAAWERSDAYRARRTAFGDRLIAAAEAVIPDLRRHIVLRSDGTPVTMARFDWSTDGAIYGVQTSERFRGSKSPLPGLVLAGSANFGGGTEAVVISGALAADSLIPGLLRRGGARTDTRQAA